MTIEEIATLDIKNDLRKQSRCFLAFREKLNPIMDKLVDNYIKIQEECNDKGNIQGGR